jgi:Cys-tRNA(Pro)/Cys-tRNA(Cys) deacylase
MAVKIPKRGSTCYDRSVMHHVKTNALRILESMGIAHDVAAHPVGEEHFDAVAVAGLLGVNPDILFKTLVAHDERGSPLVFVVPGNTELDLKKAARAADAKKVELISLRDLTPLTGYVRGGCSPVGMKKKLPTWIDEIASSYDRIYVNAGARGMQMIIAPADLLRAADALYADLV